MPPLQGYFSILLPALLRAFSVTSCTPSQTIPPWFEAIQRLPIHTVHVNGHRIAYLDIGEGPPVILIHGLGGSMWQWEHQQAALSPNHRVITLDLLGSGLSDKPETSYTPERLLDFFRAFMDELGIQKAALIGNSMGAGLVIGMALTHPDRVTHLILIDGLPERLREQVASPQFKRFMEWHPPSLLAKLGNWLAGQWMTKSVLEEIVYDSTLLTPLVLERSYQNRSRPGFLPPLLSILEHIPLWEEGFGTRLHEIRQPTLILWGTNDRVFPLEVGQDMHQKIPGSSFKAIPETGHIPP